MFTLGTDLVNENVAGFTEDTRQNLAIIHFLLKPFTDPFSKIEIDTSVEANWEISSNGKKLFLDKIYVELGYEDSSGAMTYKNSGMIVNRGAAKDFVPMIWVKDNSSNVYHTAYVFSTSLQLRLRYSVFFKINADTPAELQEPYKGEQEITIDTAKPSDDYSIKISLT
jgi:hypothetical protein